MEPYAYRDNLESILAFSEGRHLLSFGEVKRYTGLKNDKSLHRRYPFFDGYISAESLARCLCSGPVRKGRRP